MKKQQKQIIAAGVGLTALAAAAASVYLLTGKNAKNRKKISKWAKDLQNDVVAELHKTQKATKSSYNKIVDTISKNYKDIKNIDTQELVMMTSELKSNWDAIKDQFDSAKNSVKKVLPKATKKVAKAAKTTKKAVSKKK